MAFKAKEAIIHIKKGSVFSMRFIYSSVRDHPFVCGSVFFLLILYRYFPSLFGFVVSSSPVVVCAALLLGTLLIYSDTNVPESEVEHTIVRFRNVANYINNEAEIISEDTNVARKDDMKIVDDHYSGSESESDGVENSSPDASVADIIPILDELHPLLDSEAPQDALRSINDSDQESDTDSIEEEIENQEDEEEEDEAQEEKDDVSEAVLKWTADDQKNLMDLGTSELERNQRLENLIAKRRARKFLSFHGEKNLIDLDVNDPVPNTEDLPRINVQILSNSAPRKNPFDIPFEDESNMGLPPIPGSAPSVLQPRRNPFDIPFNGEESHDMFFPRHENFSMGASSSSRMKQEAHDSVMKPYFVAEGVNNFERDSSEKDDSEVSSDHESDSTSSDMDCEVQTELVELEVHNENPVPSLDNHYSETLDIVSQSSEEVDSIDNLHEQIRIDENSHNIILNAANNSDAVEMEIRQGDYSEHDTEDGNLEEIEEERYDDLSSSSSEAYENQSNISIQDSSKSEQERDNNSSTHLDDSTQSVSGDDGQVTEPVYDSSPSAAEKSTLDDALLFADKEDSISEDSLTSAQRQEKSEISSEEEQHCESNDGNNWSAASSLSFVDKIESRSREITEIRERDVLKVGLSRTNEELYDHPLSPVMPKKFILPLRASSNSNDASSLTSKPLTPRDVLTMLQPDRVGLDRILSNSDLPPIPEEHSEYLRLEDEFENPMDRKAELGEDNHMAIDKDDGDNEASSSSCVNQEKIRNISKFW